MSQCPIGSINYFMVSAIINTLTTSTTTTLYIFIPGGCFVNVIVFTQTMLRIDNSIINKPCVTKFT